MLNTEQTERREHKRYRTGDGCRVSFEDANTVRMKDISFGGVCLISQKEMDINSIHAIKISPPMNGEIKTKSLVVWSSRQEMLDYEAGLKFTEFSNTSKKSLEKIISNLSAKLQIGSRQVLLTIIRDITEHKKTEDRTRASLEEKMVSNTLKHVFPEGKKGEITVSMLLFDKDMIELIVTDNGIGLPADLDSRKKSSLGLSLIDALVKQLHGEIELHKEEGTRFRIAFRSHK